MSWHVGVVVAALGAAALVAGGDHRDAGRQAQRGQQVRGLLAAQGHDLGVVGLALDAAVPGPVVVGAVAVVLAVGLVVLVVVGDQVAQREAVVGGDEVDRGVRRAPVVGVQVGGARQPGRHLADAAGLQPPEVAHRVAVAVVPLAPRRREAADLVAVHAGVPRLGDQLHVPQHRVLADGGDEVPGQVDAVPGAGQRRREVEAEAVDVHLGDPVAQRVEDHPQRRRVRRVDGVAAAGDVEVRRAVVHPVDVLVVADVVEAAEAQRRAERAALGGVVVDHVEDHLEPGPVQRLDHRLELVDLLAAVPGRAVAVVGREEADGVVAPVVGHPGAREVGLGGELVHRAAARPW